MIRSDISIGVALIMLSVFFFVDSFSITQSTISAPLAGASFFPRVISVLLAISSIILIIKDIIRKKKSGKVEKKPDQKTGSEKYVLYMMGATTLYVIAIPTIGYLVSTIVYMITSSLFLGSKYTTPREVVSSTAIAGLISVFAYFLFGTILSVFLPRGFII
jgi:putative tricarboxylic transport membrane protein